MPRAPRERHYRGNPPADGTLVATHDDGGWALYEKVGTTDLRFINFKVVSLYIRPRKANFHFGALRSNGKLVNAHDVKVMVREYPKLKAWVEEEIATWLDKQVPQEESK